MLTPAFQRQLERLIDVGIYDNQIHHIGSGIIQELKEYRSTSGINNVFVGISGGVDSALTAALFKRAGYRVTGVVMPILQNPEETQRGREVCDKLGLECIEKDLTEAYQFMEQTFSVGIDPLVSEASDNAAKRRGNIRARLRMMTLYHLAAAHKGFVASTDNFSELAAGFWTLHGDVGDVAPIQSLTKSWEVPALAEFLCVPNSVIEAVPTDGLGITSSDEESFGFSYLEFDIVLLSLLYDQCDFGDKRTISIMHLEEEEQDYRIVQAVKDKIAATSFKRKNPCNLDHPLAPERFELLAEQDEILQGEQD